ncbi:hypothetical protein [Pseudarthrobacter sp. C4D7]|uniref:hypothetical protein n=1 Tax=Pseudarthrobacter sp. C4D7 TaxID=2735268 RepID=UPI0015854F7F|nr:hypothetical protein [Pseudarthrobacter sp. C4D7]NUT72168.1 hypothetical protein [Pseudarthrobacter sp. C4D7]
MSEDGTPVAYTALRKGTPVISSSGQRFGTLDTVLDDSKEDILHGLVVTTRYGPRFLSRDSIVTMTTTLIECSINDDEVNALPPAPRHRRGLRLRLPRPAKDSRR